MPEQPSTHFKLMSNVCASTTNMSDRQNMGTKAHGVDTAEQILIELKAALLTRKWLAQSSRIRLLSTVFVKSNPGVDQSAVALSCCSTDGRKDPP